MESKYPGLFRFDLRRDAGTTGRLEVTIYFNQTSDKDGKGVLVHSKSKGQGYIHQNWDGFFKRVDDAIANNWRTFWEKEQIWTFLIFNVWKKLWFTKICDWLIWPSTSR